MPTSCGSTRSNETQVKFSTSFCGAKFLPLQQVNSKLTKFNINRDRMQFRICVTKISQKLSFQTKSVYQGSSLNLNTSKTAGNSKKDTEDKKAKGIKGTIKLRIL